MSNRVSNDQVEALLDFLSEHPAIARGVGLGSRSKSVQKQWNVLALKLNAFGSGSANSGERWRKYWADLKLKTMTRVARGGPSSQGDLTEVDKKVLSIIGEQAVFGDTEHRIPLFYNEADTPGPSQEVVVLDGEEENLPVVISVPPMVTSSRRGHTTRVYADNIEAGLSTSTHQNLADSDGVDDSDSQQLPPTETQQEPRFGAESPVSRPITDRSRLRSVRAVNTIPSRITPEWVKDLESRRVEAETKLANAALIMAEASRLQAETARAQAANMRELVELVHRQSDDIRALLEMTRAANQNQQ